MVKRHYARNSRTKPRGFTLVELLVVISIIGMLMALLLPAVQAARESGRRNTCANNSNQLALSLVTFAEGKRFFPGYVNSVGSSTFDQNGDNTTGKHVSWIVPLLAYMDRNDLYSKWNDPTVSLADCQNLVSPTLAILICPSDPPETQGGQPLSYVVNAGEYRNIYPPDPHASSPNNQWESGQVSHIAGSGVCHFNALDRRSPINVRVGLDAIVSNDGATNTMVLTENVQAQNWNLSTTGGSSISSTDVVQKMKRDLCFYWVRTDYGTDPTLATTSSGVIPASTDPQKINAFRTYPAVNGLPKAPYNVTRGVFSSWSDGDNDGLGLSRPSSNHPGGVNAAFCDRHVKFIAEDIQYEVYKQLMSPNMTAAISPTQVQYLLDDKDY